MRHKFNVSLFSLLVGTAIVAPAPGQAQQQTTKESVGSDSVPRLVQFSGTVKEAAGRSVAGVTFALYKDQEGGTSIWMETQNVALDESGRYTVLLGSTKAEGLPKELFASGEARWLGVQPEGQPEQSRVMLLSVPYALKAADAETLGGRPVSAFILSESQPASSASAVGSGGVIAPVVPRAMPEATTSADAGTLATACSPVTVNSAAAGQIAKYTAPCTIGGSPVISEASGAASIAGVLQLPAIGTATLNAGFNSQPVDLLASSFSKTLSKSVNQHFRWQAEPVGNNTSSPSGKLSLLFASGTSTLAETGLSISSNGIINFATGQTLPIVTGNETVSGNVSAKQLISTVATGTAPFSVSSTTMVPNLNASLVGGMPASSLATHGSNAFTGFQSIAGNGLNMYIGDVACPTGTVGIQAQVFSFGCNNFALLLDTSGNTIVNAPSGNLFLGVGDNNIVTITGGGVGIGSAPAVNSPLFVDATKSSGKDGGIFLGGPGTASNSPGDGLFGGGGDGNVTGGTGGDGGSFQGGTPQVSGATGGRGVFAHGGDGASGSGELGGFGIEAFGGQNSDGTIARAGEFHGDVEVTGCFSVSPGTMAHQQFGLCLSDVRLKKNIQSFPVVLDKLVRLQPVSYEWRVEEFPERRLSPGRSPGLIAQEVEKVFPEMVTVDQSGFKRVNYGELPYLMLQAIRELKAENDNLRERIQRLEELARH